MSQKKSLVEREVKRGYWLYDGVLQKTVVIFCVNYDYYYELEDDGYADMSDEVPQLNEQGESYIVRWPTEKFVTSTGQFSTSFGGLTLDKAVAEAERIVAQNIRWLS